jgi:ParB-like chromosome segregation protein Spo0J
MADLHWQLELIPFSIMKVHFKNPRSLSIEQHQQIDASMDRFGLIEKPVLNKDLTIIGGHQRIGILKAKGIESCLCWVPERLLTEVEVDELNIRLNKNTGEWDWEILANEWDQDKLLDWGFSDKDLGLSSGSEVRKSQKFSDSDGLTQWIPDIERIAMKSSARMKISS